MNDLIVEPWVGESYENPRNIPNRTLILGESNYTESPEQFNPSIVINCVSDDLCGDDPQGFGRFATKLRRIIFGEQSNMKPEEFWPDVAFYNFVQYLVGDAARQRPTSEMWLESVPVFSQVINELKPEKVLVLGLENWRNLLKAVPHNTVSEFQSELIVGEYKVLAGYVFHPSSSLTYSEWHPRAKELLFNG